MGFFLNAILLLLFPRAVSSQRRWQLCFFAPPPPLTKLIHLKFNHFLSIPSVLTAIYLHYYVYEKE